MRIPHPRQVDDVRPRVQFLKHQKPSSGGLQPHDPAVRIIGVTKDDRSGRTGLLAGGADRPVGHGLAAIQRRKAGLIDSLHAERAFLHHPHASDGHLRIESQFLNRILQSRLVIAEEVEPPHLVGAVVRAVARADAAVVDHLVEPVGAVCRCVDGAHRFTWSAVTVLAHHRLVTDDGIVRVAVLVAVDTNPVHLAALADLLPPDNGDVVLSLARGHADAAPDALAQVDGHHPLVSPGVIHRRVHIDHPGPVPSVLHEVGFAPVLLQSPVEHNRPALHRKVLLRSRELPGPVGLAHCGVDGQPRSVGILDADQRGDIHSAPLVCDSAAGRATVAQLSNHRAIGRPVLDHNRQADRPATDGHRDPITLVHAEGFRGLPADRRPVVPDNLADRVRQFLQPAVVRESAVMHRMVRYQNQLILSHLGLGVRHRFRRRAVQLRRFHRLGPEPAANPQLFVPRPLGGLLPSALDERMPVGGLSDRIVRGRQPLRPSQQ